MAENLEVNGVTYNGVESIAMTNAAGEQVMYYADAVRYVQQELTEEQQTQARTNIGAASATEVDELKNKIDESEQQNDAITNHNNDTTAHPSLQTDITGLDGRLTALEARFGGDITGNSFSVTFGDLDGLIVTGVWNKLHETIEF